MTFADRLEELRKAATPGEWKVTECMDYWVEHSNKITALDKGFNGIAHCGDMDWPNYENKQREWEANARMIALLANNADAILGLVRAAEVMVGHADGDDLEAELRAVEALAKLNGEQT